MIKRLIAIAFLLVVSLFSVHSATVLTNCNVLISSNTEYHLNFDEIEAGVGAYGGCLYSNVGLTNVTIKQISEERTTLTGATSLVAIKGNSVGNGFDISEMDLIDLNIETGILVDNNKDVHGSDAMEIDNLTITNSKIKTTQYLIRWFNHIANVDWDNVTIENSIIETPYISRAGGWTSTGCEVNVINSLLDNNGLAQSITNSCGLTGTSTNTAFKVNYIGTPSNVVQGNRAYTDSDFDGIDDIDSRFLTRLDLNLFGEVYTTISKKSDVSFNYFGKTLVPMKEDTLAFGVTDYELILGTTLDLSVTGVTDVSTRKSIQLEDGSLDCSIISSAYCYLTDAGNLAHTGEEYRGMITVMSDSVINNIDIDKTYDNNVHLISNEVASYIHDVTITNNNLYSENNFLIDFSETLNTPFIKLKGSKITITDNLFTFYNASSVASAEYLYIDSNSPNNNEVTRNEFYNLVATPTVPSAIFNYQGDTKFYNNYLGDDVIISNVSMPNINVSPIVPFEYNNKLYYFQIGNYYEDNVACVDTDVNGICDSAYVSGTVTDAYPLAEHPFNFTKHLIDAIAFDDLDFDITLVAPANASVVSVVDASTLVEFKFNHNSNLLDLDCEYYIDGAYVEGSVKTDTVRDVDYSINLNGWTEKTYTYAVACYNEYTSITSDTHVFEIVFGEVPIDDGIGAGDTSGLISNVDIIGDSAEENVDNVKDFAQSVVNPFFNYGILILVLIGIILAIGLIIALFSVI